MYSRNVEFNQHEKLKDSVVTAEPMLELSENADHETDDDEIVEVEEIN